FAECHGPNMKLSFPSKLADYTATGLPILIWAPPYSSAVRWARENEGAAEVVDNQNPAALEKAVKRLTGNGDHQTRLGKTALDMGRAYFSHDAACAAFRELVGSARPDKLHLGCGLNTAKDWINLDGSLNAWMAKRPFLRKALRGLHLIPSGLADVPWSPDIFIWNVRRPLPFQENSMSAIYASHLLEHLYFDESERLLKECFRLLRQGGVLRMLVPNGSKRMATLRRSANGPNRDYPFPDPDAPPRSVLSRMWAALRSPNNRSSNIAYRLYSSLQNLHQHKLLYDADSLVGSFRRAGFAEVTQMQAFQSRIEGIERIEIGERADSGSICIEGVKPGN
ncbi:MAG TPA: methyltransferase domain-containing protein, partial [Nitrospiria bacterium]|nr:methyltransferase domain-containing protein [Nitrospiria bacterium]